MIVAVLALLTGPAPPKHNARADECEVLEMDFVQDRGCVCVCWDPADRAYFTFDNPECVDRE